MFHQLRNFDMIFCILHTRRKGAFLSWSKNKFTAQLGDIALLANKVGSLKRPCENTRHRIGKYAELEITASFFPSGSCCEVLDVHTESMVQLPSWVCVDIPQEFSRFFVEGDSVRVPASYYDDSGLGPFKRFLWYRSKLFYVLLARSTEKVPNEDHDNFL